MRKLFAAALALCLVFAFAMPAAAEMKITGQLNIQGYSWDSTDVRKDQGTNQQWYTEKLRLAFKAEPEEGVGVYARGDVWDNHVWGVNDGDGGSVDDFGFDYAYGWFTTSFGKFTLGRMAGGQWGTTWGDDWRRADRIVYENAFGPIGIVAIAEKFAENDKGTTSADDDYDKYNVGGVYKWDGGQAGVLLSYNDDASVSDTASYKGQNYAVTPYMKATFGPVYLEAEFNKRFGQQEKYEDGLTTADVDVSGMNYYAEAKVNFGPAYVGGFYGYVQGDDPNTAENECGFSGDDYDMGFILFTDEDWGPGGNVGNITTHGSNIHSNMGQTGASGVVTGDGAKVYGLRFGVSPIEKLSIKGALVTGSADEKDTYVNDDFGTEFDLEASYKLFSSVTYTVRFGYLWTGDYWKGTSAANEVDDIYMIHHCLVWNF